MNLQFCSLFFQQPKKNTNLQVNPKNDANFFKSSKITLILSNPKNNNSVKVHPPQKNNTSTLVKIFLRPPATQTRRLFDRAGAFNQAIWWSVLQCNCLDTVVENGQFSPTQDWPKSGEMPYISFPLSVWRPVLDKIN